MELNPIKGIVGAADELAGTVFNGIDSIVTTEEEKRRLKAQVQKQLIDFREKAMEVTKKQMDAQVEVMKAETNTPFWRNWRALVMLGIFVLAFLHSILDGVNFFTSAELKSVLEWGLGAYGLAEGATQGAKHFSRGKVAQSAAEKERHRAEAEKHRRARASVENYDTPTVETPTVDVSGVKPAPPAQIDSTKPNGS